MQIDQPLAGKKVLIIHFRVGKTDGVSIEIEAWKRLLTSAGATVRLCSGPINIGADYVITKLEQQLDPEVFALDEAAYGKSAISDEEFAAKVDLIQQSIIKDFDEILTDFKPDRIIISNIFSVGEHFAAAYAFTTVLDKWKIKTLAVHHDFWWENIRYKRPSYALVTNQLTKYFPPSRPWLSHTTINSIAKTALHHLKGISSQIIYDTEDFKTPIETLAPHASLLIGHCSHDKNDIIILQATRIVRRKNIEIAIDLVAGLNQKLKQSEPLTLSPDRTFDPNLNQAILVLAGYAEKRDEKYQAHLLAYAKEKGVSLCQLGDLINASDDQFSLYDAYPSADIITYPSEYEGFGNQFLEAIHAKKPVAVFKYPVFKTDIAPLGFEYISLGDTLTADDQGLKHIPPQILDQAVDQIIVLLKNQVAYKNMVEKNYSLGMKNFSHETTLKLLEKLLA